MKHLFTLLLSFVFAQLLTAQSTTNSTYFFNGNFTEATGGIVLTESLACGAGAGVFGTEIITRAVGTCGTTPANTFKFNDGGGVQYSNTTGFVSGSYTIHVFSKFNTLGGYSRIIDFSNSASDNGIYLLGNCLNFYPSGNIGPSCPFEENKFYLLSFSRDSTTKIITVYVDGVLYTTYNDATNLYVSPNGNTPVNFFRDDNAVPCEAQPGSIKYLSIQRQPSTAAQVTAVYSNICNIVLPVTLTKFNGTLSGNKASLTWLTAGEINSAYFAIEHSINSIDYKEVGRVQAAGSSGESNYSFTHLLSDKNNYYRLKQVDKDGRFTYSAVINLKLDSKPSIAVFPNPTEGKILVCGLIANGEITISTTEGKVVYKQKLHAQTIVINMERFATGTYLLQYNDGSKVFTQKVIKK